MTRRATLAVCLLVVAVVASGTVFLGRTATSSTPPVVNSAFTTPTVAPAGPVPKSPSPTVAGDAGGDGGGDPNVAQERIWRPAVVNFGRNFTNTVGGTRAWRARLAGPSAHPYVTTAVAAQLATVDTSNVPLGRFEGYRIVSTESGAYQTVVKIDYSEGWSLILYLVTDGSGWQISAYDRYEA